MAIQIKKYRLLVCALVLSTAAGVIATFSGVRMPNKAESPGAEMLRMANVFLKGGKDLDPGNITNLQEYELVRNLYGRLIEYNIRGELVPGIATSFSWQKEDLVFTFGEKARTIDGHLVNAEDAARSLKRAILLKKTGHGDLRNFLCPEQHLDSIDDDCPGIKVEENRLILTPVKKSLGPHLLAMLQSADFSIIPRLALSTDPKNPVVVSHRNTSGPYYVTEDKNSGAWLLKANPQHYLFSPDMPQTVALEPTTGSDVGSLLEESKIDLIPTPVFFAGPEADRIMNDRNSYSIHESMPIKVIMICFKPSSMLEFSAEQRFFAASLIEKYLNANAKIPGMKSTVEFFQALSDGSLDETQRNTLKNIRSNIQRPKFAKPISVGATGRSYELLKQYLAPYPELVVVNTEVSAYQLPVDERPDLYVVSSDAAWMESVSLLGHNFHVRIFHLPGVNGDQWIKDYAETEVREQRIAKLRDLHFQLLKSATIYPVSVSPYYAIARKQWTLPFSTFSAGTELWNVRRTH